MTAQTEPSSSRVEKLPKTPEEVEYAPGRRPAATRAPVTEAELEVLLTLLGELNATWAARVREEGVSWKIRRVKSLWGCCHWRDRYITYNAELAHAPRDLVEYVVVHEYTHFVVHNHGPRFYALMDERLPGWQTLRKRLNHREWGETRQDEHLAQTPASRQTFGLEDIQPHPAQTPLTGSLRLGDSCVAPEPVAAPSVAPPAAFGCLRATRSGCPRVPAAPVTQQGAKGRKLTFVQGELRW